MGFTQAAKSALWAKDFKWRSELVGPDGKTALVTVGRHTGLVRVVANQEQQDEHGG